LEDTKKGNRPSFGEAAEPHVAERLYEHFCTALAALGVPVESGVFGARMRVDLANNGPGHDRARSVAMNLIDS
jgi:D-tyrosyl-tRNA(Tyr) deacylase